MNNKSLADKIKKSGRHSSGHSIAAKEWRRQQTRRLRELELDSGGLGQEKIGERRSCWSVINRSPLDKWFMSQVGRPWDKVYSSFRQKFTRESIGRYTHKDVVAWIVYLNVHIIDGHPHEQGSRKHRPLLKNDLYVHPTDGLLKKTKRNYVCKFLKNLPN